MRPVLKLAASAACLAALAGAAQADGAPVIAAFDKAAFEKGGRAVVGYRIRNNHGKEADLAATDRWISRASGTPLFTSIGLDEGGGFRWVHGSSVLPPVPGAGK